MGWTSNRREPGTTDLEYFMDEFDTGTVVHAHGSVNSVFYAAIETPENPGVVTGFIALMRRNPNDYWYNFTFKTMDETSGPGCYGAPAKVLDALTDTDNTYALEWRDKCRLRLEQRAFLRDLREGDKVVFWHKVRFTDKTEHDTFEIARDYARGGRTKVALKNGHQRYRFANWRDKVVAIIRDDTTEILTPMGQRREENAYVDRVTTMQWHYREDILRHYGVEHNYGSVGWLARVEFRENGPWEGLDDLERNVIVKSAWTVHSD